MSRIAHHKRQHLTVEAVRYTKTSVKLVIVGKGDDVHCEHIVSSAIERFGVQDKVIFRAGWISEDEKMEYYARCVAVICLPFDEDSCGYPSLEAHHASKCVISTTDAGGTSELIVDGQNEFLPEPSPQAGHANENKRIHIILQALAADHNLASTIAYFVIGDTGGPFAKERRKLREDLNLQHIVRFTGYVPDDLLRSFLIHAGFCVNLRWPAMEGGSASCAEPMLSGKASIVTDTGIYSELPDDCVYKVRAQNELEDLVHHLHERMRDVGLCKSAGEQACSYADANFSADVYARRFLDFCSELAYYVPAPSLIDAAGQELQRIGVSSDMAIVDTVVREGALLTEGDYDPPVLRKKWSC